MRWIMGYIECQVPGGHLERFMNLCRHHEIELWKVKEREKQAVFFMYAAEYSKLRPLARKTKTVPHIRKKCGTARFQYNQLRFVYAVYADHARAVHLRIGGVFSTESHRQRRIGQCFRNRSV